MTKTTLSTCIVLLTFTSATQAAPAHPQIPLWNAAAINAFCDAKIDGLRKLKAQMEARQSPSGIFEEWNRLAISINDLDGPLSLTANVAVDQATRAAADACELKLTPFATDLFQSEALYGRVRQVKPADAIQTQYQKDLIESFEDNGVTLPPEKRARVKAINQRIADLAQQFDKNIRDDGTKLVFAPSAMAGLPESYLTAQKRDDQGNYVLPLAYPSFFPFMQLASNGDARRRYWVAKMNEGGAANLALLDEIVKLRLELAQLYGEPDYASYTLKRRMAATPAAVYKFLDEVKGAVSALEKKEIDELAVFKAEEGKQPKSAVRIERWDVSYYQEKLKKARFKVDQEALRKYFPTEASIAYTLKVAETLYGIVFVPSNAPTWHSDVRVFDVFDAPPNASPNRPPDAPADGERGAFIGSVYLDLFPRDGKFNHAAAWPVRGVSTLAKENGSYRTPISALVANLDRKGLNRDELEVLLHEFGHVLHGILSKTRYVDESGTNVKWDFAEAPSQMFEEWSRREEPLALFEKICADCPHLSHEQIAQIEAARKWGRGLFYARQWLLAAYDMSLTTPKPGGALASWDRLEGATPLGHVPGTMFPAGFGHLVRGYAAGYYGYMWSEVLALDMLSGFHGKLMNPADGKRYRDDILSRGGEAPPEQLVESFLGRKPTSDAFFKEITGKR